MFKIVSLVFLFLIFTNVNADSKPQDAKPQQQTQLLEEKPIADFDLSFCTFMSNHMVYLGGKHSQVPSNNLISMYEFSSKKGEPLVHKYESLLPEKVTLNYTKEQANPLFGKHIDQCIMVSGFPTVTCREFPGVLYQIQKNNKECSIVTTCPITNAQGQDAKITKLCEGFAQNNFYAIALVKNQEDHDKTDGIALIKYNVPPKEDETKKNDDPPKPFLDVLDAMNGISKGNKTYSFESVIDQVLSINNGFDSANYTIADLYWEKNLERFYCALQIKTKDDATQEQGACALVVGKIHNDALTFKSFVNHAAVKNEHGIVTATGASQYISLHKVRSLYTTTGLVYLLVLGGKGKPESTKSQVYALPVCDKNNEGTLASNKQVPVTAYTPTEAAHYYETRIFQHEAASYEDMVNVTNPCAIVGGAKPLPGQAKELMVVGDAVYALVSLQDSSCIYHSQPIFDSFGRIASWTDWHPALISQNQILAMSLDAADSSWHLFEKNNVDNSFVMRKTGWIYDEQLSSLFKQEEGGITGLFDFSADTHGLNGHSLLIATGYNKVVIQANKQILSLPCNDLGHITAATIAHDEKQAWVFVGGQEGLAVLSHADGSGWSLKEGLSPSMQEFGQMCFKKIGNNTGIKKLISDEDNVYLLTNKKLEQIKLKNKREQEINNVCLCQNTTIVPGQTRRVFDVGVFGNVVLLATTGGLFYTAKDKAFDQVKSGEIVRWQKIELPINEELIHSFYFICQKGNENNSGQAAQVFVVVNSLYDRSGVLRLYIDSNGVTVVPDHYSRYNKYNYFCSFGSLRTSFVTDGAVYMHVGDRTTKELPDVRFLPEGIRGGKYIEHYTSRKVPLNVEHINFISNIVRNSATGNWMIAGDFGLMVNK